MAAPAQAEPSTWLTRLASPFSFFLFFVPQALNRAVADARMLRMSNEVRVGTKHLQKIATKRVSFA